MVRFLNRISLVRPTPTVSAQVRTQTSMSLADGWLACAWEDHISCCLLTSSYSTLSGRSGHNSLLMNRQCAIIHEPLPKIARRPPGFNWVWSYQVNSAGHVFLLDHRLTTTNLSVSLHGLIMKSPDTIHTDLQRVPRRLQRVFRPCGRCFVWVRPEING